MRCVEKETGVSVWVSESGIRYRFSTPKGIIMDPGALPYMVDDFRFYNVTDLTYGVSIPYGRLVVNAQYWKCLVGLSRAGIPKEVCLI